MPEQARAAAAVGGWPGTARRPHDRHSHTQLTGGQARLGLALTWKDVPTRQVCADVQVIAQRRRMIAGAAGRMAEEHGMHGPDRESQIHGKTRIAPMPSSIPFPQIPNDCQSIHKHIQRRERLLDPLRCALRRRTRTQHVCPLLRSKTVWIDECTLCWELGRRSKAGATAASVLPLPLPLPDIPEKL